MSIHTYLLIIILL